MADTLTFVWQLTEDARRQAAPIGTAVEVPPPQQPCLVRGHRRPHPVELPDNSPSAKWGCFCCEEERMTRLLAG